MLEYLHLGVRDYLPLKIKKTMVLLHIRNYMSSDITITSQKNCRNFKICNSGGTYIINCCVLQSASLRPIVEIICFILKQLTYNSRTLEVEER
jgi:hypothetical protein